MGKGSRKRPSSIPPEEYAKRFEYIFGKKKMWWEDENRDLSWLIQKDEDNKNRQHIRTSD